MGESLSLLSSSMAYAKPDLQPLGANIADQGSNAYQFQIHHFQSIDQQRNYKVWLGIPKHINKNKALPVIFMLGNAVMARLNESLLTRLSNKTALFWLRLVIRLSV